jgi:hypothetical protein
MLTGGAYRDWHELLFFSWLCEPTGTLEEFRDGFVDEVAIPMEFLG